MTAYMGKSQLLERDSTGYEELARILASLNEAQMTIAGVHGDWSVKDILAHLAAWHEHLLNLIYAVVHKEEPLLMDTMKSICNR